MSTGQLRAVATGAAHQAAQSAAAETEQQRAIAEVQAASIMAKKYPRDQVAALDRVLQACTRQRVAEEGCYTYTRGTEEVSGPSIRLAETIAQQWGNLQCGVKELSRRDGVSECLAYAWDLESNFRDEKTFQVRHWRDTKKGGYAVTDERDIYEVVANQGARRKRACILAVIPQDVQDEAVAQCDQTLSAKIEVTPERIAEMLGKFKSFGVSQEMIEQRLGRRIDTLTPSGMLRLGKIHNSIRDGMGTVADYFETPAAAAGAPTPQSGTAGLKEKTTGKGAKKTPPPAEPASGSSPSNEGAKEEVGIALGAVYLERIAAAATVQAVDDLATEISKDDRLTPADSQTLADAVDGRIKSLVPGA